MNIFLKDYLYVIPTKRRKYISGSTYATCRVAIFPTLNTENKIRTPQHYDTSTPHNRRTARLENAQIICTL